MTTETPRYPGIQERARDNRPPARWSQLRRLVVLVVLVAGCLVAVWLWSLASERHALMTMDPARRRALFEETRTSFRTMCGGPEVDGLASRCQSQAEFLKDFPECDAACRAELSPVLDSATR